MLKKWAPLLLVLLSVTIAACRYYQQDTPATKGASPDSALVTAGRRLFFDTRLSFNNTKSCGSCHDPKFAFTDGYRRSITAAGENLAHNSPSLINAALLRYFDWANPAVRTLEKQQERPLFNTHPAELGVTGNEKLILQRIESDPLYPGLFQSAFPGETPAIDFPHIIRAIAAFEKTLQSQQSPYDLYVSGDSNALSAEAKQGMNLFFSAKLHCGNCHTPPLFTTAAVSNNPDSIYFNTGLYNINNGNLYPGTDRGLAAITGKVADEGKFKVPSLRNVALTAPYMHDGSINTLEEAMALYEAGGRNIPNGPYAGDGRTNSHKHPLISGFHLQAGERRALMSFLYSLTDSSVLTNPRFQNPFNLPNK